MTLVRVVFDTNVIISPLLGSRNDLVAPGRPFLCLQLALAGAIQPVVSEEILQEYEVVLLRAKFAFSRTTVRHFLAEIRTSATMTEPALDLSPELVTDALDLPILSTAVAGSADYLVTGNIKHFPTKCRGVSVVTPREFLEAWLATER